MASSWAGGAWQGEARGRGGSAASLLRRTARGGRGQREDDKGRGHGDAAMPVLAFGARRGRHGAFPTARCSKNKMVFTTGFTTMGETQTNKKPSSIANFAE